MTTKLPFLKNSQNFAYEAVIAWGLLFVSALAFAVIGVVLTQIGFSDEQALLSSALIVGPLSATALTVGLYHVRNHNKTEKNADEHEHTTLTMNQQSDLHSFFEENFKLPEVEGALPTLKLQSQWNSITERYLNHVMHQLLEEWNDEALLRLRHVQQQYNRTVHFLNQLQEDETSLGPFNIVVTGSALRADTQISFEILVNVYETDDLVVVDARLPGFAIDEISMNLSGNTLELEARRSPSDQEQNAVYHIREWSRGPLFRTVKLPTEIDSDRHEIIFENGVLTVRVPKIAGSTKYHMGSGHGKFTDIKEGEAESTFPESPND